MCALGRNFVEDLCFGTDFAAHLLYDKGFAAYSCSDMRSGENSWFDRSFVGG